MEFVKLNHADKRQAECIQGHFFDSYSVEARLIGIPDFPPLRRTVDNIRSAQSSFVGCMINDRLVAVAEIERKSNGSANIAGFAVRPSSFRRGIGSRLLCHLLDTLGNSQVTVSTAWENKPAISLYETHGFRVANRWATQSGIDMVTLLKADEA